jgi:hypothetical protein
MDDIPGVIESQKSVLQKMIVDVAFSFIPSFVLSEDFKVYFETFQSRLKAHNKKLRIDSKVS